MTQNKQLAVQTHQAVDVSDLVAWAWSDQTIVDRFWFELTDHNAPFTWGDNNRTLISGDRLLDYIETAFVDELLSPDQYFGFQPGFDILRTKLEELHRDGVYIDLEN